MKKIILATSIIFMPFIVFSQEYDGNFYDWHVLYNDKEESVKDTCYAMSFAIDRKGSISESNDATKKPYIMLTHFYDTHFEELSVFSGYKYKGKSKIYLDIDGEYFEMITKGDIAWAENSVMDKKILKKLITSKEVKIRSDFSDGKYSIDSYSLKGFNQSYSRIRKLCDFDIKDYNRDEE